MSASFLKSNLAVAYLEQGNAAKALTICGTMDISSVSRDDLIIAISDFFVKEKTLEEALSAIEDHSQRSIQAPILAKMAMIYETRNSRNNASKAILNLTINQLHLARYGLINANIDYSTYSELNDILEDFTLRDKLNTYFSNKINKNMFLFLTHDHKTLIKRVDEWVRSSNFHADLKGLKPKSDWESRNESSRTAPSDTNKSHENALGVVPGDSLETIRKKYIKLLKIHHTDKVHQESLETDEDFITRKEASEEKTKEINEAFATLSNKPIPKPFDIPDMSSSTRPASSNNFGGTSRPSGPSFFEGRGFEDFFRGFGGTSRPSGPSFFEGRDFEDFFRGFEDLFKGL